MLLLYGDDVYNNVVENIFESESLRTLNIPENKLKQLERASLVTIQDVLQKFPKKYLDARHVTSFAYAYANPKTMVHIRATVKYLNNHVPDNLRYTLETERGGLVYLTWFHAAYMENRMHIGDVVDIVAKFESGKNRQGRAFISCANPKFIAINSNELNKIIPVYKKVKGMSDEYYEGVLNQCLQDNHVNDYLSGEMLSKYNLCTLPTAWQYLHKPDDVEALKKGKKRIVFDDLFLFNFMLKEKSVKNKSVSPFRFTGAKLLTEYYKTLPFDLTEGQKEAIRTLYKEGKSGKKINVLLQADVGYGKTECAKLFSLLGVEAGYQAVILAPTMVLAQQHYADFKKSFEPIGVTVDYLAADLTATQRKKVLQNVKSGKTQVLVGTHSCISDSVEYKSLGCVVVDEEHRFGVKQREKLAAKTENGVHTLSMSATPIPRSLASALYGDETEVIDIKTAPAFKKPIKTALISKISEEKPLLMQELNAGHQVYVVCPAIDDNDDMATVTDVAQQYEELLKDTSYKVGMLHGSMKKSDISKNIKDFADNNVQVLVSTTVVEVGVNVKNATLMIIKDADRFGLAQLHQLRGRVGRGKDQGYCLLESESNKEALQVLVDSNDGFIIAQEDLRLRGAGRLTGTEQSGKNRYLDEMLKYPNINKMTKELVTEIFKDEDELEYFEDYFRGAMEMMKEENEE